MNKVILSCLLLAVVISRDYPLYKQCDGQWGNDTLGKSSRGISNTICQAGCLMTSAAMALSGTGHNQTPKTLNTWLINNGGYVSGNIFVWASINKFGLTFQGLVANSAIKSSLDAGKVVIVNVNAGKHWVLAHGYNGDNILVNDPLYSKTSYTLGQIINGNNGVYTVPKLNTITSIYEQAKELFMSYFGLNDVVYSQYPAVEIQTVMEE